MDETNDKDRELEKVIEETINKNNYNLASISDISEIIAQAVREHLKKEGYRKYEGTFAGVCEDTPQEDIRSVCNRCGNSWKYEHTCCGYR